MNRPLSWAILEDSASSDEMVHVRNRNKNETLLHCFIVKETEEPEH